MSLSMKTNKFNDKDVRFTYRLLGHKNETEIRLIDPTKKNPPRSIFVKTEDRFVAVCSSYNGIYNIYVGINERSTGGKTADKVITINVFIIDVDATRKDSKNPATVYEMADARSVSNRIYTDLASKSYSFYFAKSGNGYQIWIPLPPTPPTEQLATNIDYLQKQTKKIYKSKYATIDNMGDLARIIRVVGTQNMKGGTLSRWYYGINGHNKLIRCKKALKFLEELEVPPTPEFVEPDVESKGHKEAIKYLKKHKLGYELYQGKWDNERYDSRSEAEFALVCILLFEEFSREDIDAVMQSCAIGKWNEAPQQYRDLTYKNAVRFQMKKEDV